MRVTAVAGAPPAANRSEAVTVFTTAAMDDALARSAACWRKPAAMLETLGSDALINWAQAHDLRTIVTPFAPVGPVSDQLRHIAPDLAAADIGVVPVRRRWDSAAWPHAAKGFFAFKDKIPGLIGV